MILNIITLRHIEAQYNLLLFVIKEDILNFQWTKII